MPLLDEMLGGGCGGLEPAGVRRLGDQTQRASALLGVPGLRIASRSLSGKSPRIGLSPHARGFLASAGSSEAGFLTVPGSFVFRQIEVDVFGG